MICADVGDRRTRLDQRPLYCLNACMEALCSWGTICARFALSACVKCIHVLALHRLYMLSMLKIMCIHRKISTSIPRHS